MTAIEALIARNMGPHYQNVAPLWWPLSLKLSGRAKYAWLRLPNNGFISYGLEPDYDERLVIAWGPFCLTRPETEQERLDREDDEADQAFMEYELNRYTQWYY